MKNIPNFLDNFKKADYLFLAGDIGYPIYPKYNSGLFYQFISWCCNNYKKVFYVLGNHEAYNSNISDIIISIKNIEKEKDNFIFLEKGVISELEGYKVIGCTLWSDINFQSFLFMNDCNYIKVDNEKITLNNILNYHKEDKKWLEDNIDYNTIVMTHHLPSYNLINEKWKNSIYNSGFASNCDELIYKSKLWIYGHTHIASDIIYDNITRCICNPYGYFNDDDKYSNFSKEIFEIL